MVTSQSIMKNKRLLNVMLYNNVSSSIHICISLKLEKFENDLHVLRTKLNKVDI